jgi:hypothetical protein
MSEITARVTPVFTNKFSDKAKQMRLTYVAVPVMVLPFLLAGCSDSATSSQSASPSATAAASIARAAAGVVNCPDLAGPEGLPDYFDFNLKYGVNVSFTNNTEWPMALGAGSIDCYDFSGANNPSNFDGVVVTPGSTSKAYPLVARRVCAWATGDIIGKFQERKANWQSTATFGDVGSAKLPSTLSCSSFRQQPTMCKGGTSQDKDSFTVDLGTTHAARIDLACKDENITITASKLY